MQESLIYLDRLVIDDYGDDEIHLNIFKIYERLSDTEKKKVDIYLRLENKFFGNRAGFAGNRKKMKKSLNSACACSFEQLVIRSDGHVSRCCNNAWGVVDMGNVRRNSLLEIWNSNEYKKS